MSVPKGKKHAFPEDRQKKIAFYRYKRLLRKEGLTTPGAAGGNKGSASGKQKRTGTNSIIQTYKKRGPKVKNKEEVAQEIRKSKEEKQKKVKEKKKRHNKLTKRTKKGQPVMKNKMEVMLEKIMSNKDVYLA